MRFTLFFLLSLLLTSAPAGFGSVFVTANKYATGDYPVDAAVQDFNNDGVSDIASVSYSTVSVLLNHGDGTFAPANTFSVGDNTRFIASADLNRDGKADLVVTGLLQSAWVILGNGDGTFGQASQIDIGTG